MKLRQVNYKMELDKKFKELQGRKKGSISELARKEDDLVQFQQKQVENRALQDEVHLKKMLDNQKKDAMMGVCELNEK